MDSLERNYSASEREAMAVIFAVRNFCVYLFSSEPFRLVTDHQALRCASQKKYIHGRLTRWLNFLAEYEFTIDYKSGKHSAAADSLSLFLRFAKPWDKIKTIDF